MSIFKDPTLNAMVDAVDNPKKVSTRTASLMNCDRGEYGTITVDLDLLEEQIKWLLCEAHPCDEREGILNLLEGILDLADPPDDEEDEEDGDG